MIIGIFIYGNQGVSRSHQSLTMSLLPQPPQWQHHHCHRSRTGISNSSDALLADNYRSSSCRSHRSSSNRADADIIRVE